MKCKRCIERGQPDNFASPVSCAFETGEFRDDNWNCATVNKLRELAGEDDNDTQTGTSFYIYYNDRSYASLFVPPNANDVPDGEEIGPWRGGGMISMAWYKHRGQTEVMLRVDPRHGGTLGMTGKPLTLEEAESAIDNIAATQ